MADVAVIILNYNGKEFLEPCFAALAAQTYKNFRIIFVDNASSDGSAEFVRSAYPAATVIALPENRGFAGGNNAGLAATGADYVALLNNDTEPSPQWLAELVAAAAAHPECGIIASKLITYDEPPLIDSAGDGFFSCGTGYKIGHGEPAGRYAESREVFGACAGAALYTRALIDAVGFLDDRFFLVYEDTDLNFRAQLAGFKCFYAATAVVRHRVNASISRQSDVSIRFGQRNLDYVWFKSIPPGMRRRMGFDRALYRFFTSIYFFLKGKGALLASARREARRMRPQLSAEQRALLERRKASDGELMKWVSRAWFAEKFGKVRSGKRRDNG